MIIKDNRKETILKSRSFINNINEKIFIIGCNKYSVDLTSWLHKKNKTVVGYIDDYTDEVSFNNIPIVSSKINFNNKVIVNCVVEGRTIDIQNIIEKSNAKDNIDYFALQYTYPDELLAVDFLNNTDSILENIEKYHAVYNLLQDEQSKREFESLVNFRLNRDINFMRNFEFRLKEQYLEGFITLSSQPVFVDGGGYDGFTTLEFLKRNKETQKVFYFEPNISSMNLSEKNLLPYKDKIQFHRKGLWDTKTTLHFNNHLGSASHISTNGDGNITIETEKLDDIVNSKVDYIKLDIEGAEIEALNGAKNTIIKYHPKLAICIYHNQTDFIEIPELVLNFNPNYKMYLRHYTQGLFETVLYFV